MDERTALYKAFDAGGRLLYVGIARNWGSRWSQHAERSPFYATVARLEIEWCVSRAAALAREAELIRSKRPAHNIRSARPAPRPSAPPPLLAGVCEACGREPAFSFSWFPDPDDRYGDTSGTWKVTGQCTADSEHYYITFDRWINETGWLAHLRQTKNWFDEDDFVAAVGRVADRRVKAALRRQRAEYGSS